MANTTETISVFDSWLEQLNRAWRFNRKEQAEFLKALADPMKYGRSANDICEHIQLYGSPVQQEVAAQIIDSLRHGKQVTDALAGWIEPISLAALTAAEENSETFILALDVIADSLEKSAQGRSSILQKAAYPGALAAMTIAIMIYPVYPLIADLKSLIGGKPDVNLDRFSAVVEFYMYWLWLVVALGIGGFFWYKNFMENSVGEFRNSVDRISIFKGYRLSAGSNFVAIYALLKQFGMTSLGIIEIVGMSGTRYMRYHANIAEDILRSGPKTEVDALDTGILDRKHISLLHLYAGTDASVLVKALHGASNAINKQIQGRARIVANTIAILLGCWAFINITLIITVVIGFDPSQKM